MSHIIQTEPQVTNKELTRLTTLFLERYNLLTGYEQDILIEIIKRVATVSPPVIVK